MRQQINLYQPIFREERKLFSAVTVAIACGLMALTYVAIWSYGSFKVSRLAHDVHALETQAQAQETMIATAAGLRAQRANPAALDAAIAQLGKELAARNRALAVLRSGVAGEPSGFATRLEALARGHLQGVWLDHVVLTGAAGNEGSLRLEGSTLNPDFVPRYLQSLANESVLSGVRFAQFAIEGPTATTVASQPSPDAKESARGIRFRASSAALIDSDDKDAL